MSNQKPAEPAVIYLDRAACLEYLRAEIARRYSYWITTQLQAKYPDVQFHVAKAPPVTMDSTFSGVDIPGMDIRVEWR